MTREQIIEKLHKIEHDYNVRVLFAAETGSRAWGFSSPDSDWDVRFIYVHPLEWYLRVTPERDVIEVVADDGFDASGWDIRKALGLYRKKNLTFLEWLNSPITYIDNPWLREQLQTLLPTYFNRKHALYHYFHIATNHQNRYLEKRGVELKRFLYYFRALLACKWIVREQTLPPVPFRELVDALVTSDAIKAEINHILELKSQSKEHDKEIVSEVLWKYGSELEKEVEAYLTDFAVSKAEKTSDEPLNNLLYDIIMEH